MIKTDLSDKILNFLKEDYIQNLNILGVIENVKSITIYVDNVDNPRGVLVNKDYFNYIYTKEDTFIEDILNNHCKEDGFYGFSGLEESISKKLKKHFILHWESPCDLYYLPKENFNPALKTHETSEIDIKDAEKIDKYYTYRDNHSIHRIKDDITNRPGSAIYKDGEIACWVLVHDDNSMGIMYTMEEHRGHGYAVDVTIDLADKILKVGKVPFLQINRYNNMSPGLAKKCGFVKCGSAIWFGGIKGTPPYFKEISDTVNSKIKEDLGDDLFYEDFVCHANHKDFFVSLLGMKPYDKKVPDFEIKKVTNDEDIRTWCDMVSKGYAPSDQVKRADCNSKLLKLMKDNRSHYELYLGLVSGQPVSTIGFYIIEDEVAGLCYASTLPEFKDEKLDDLMVYETFSMLKNMDWSIVGIRCNEDKYEFYKGLGGVELPSQNS